MVIRPIDDGYGHRRPAQRVRREEACEAAADNHDSVWSFSRHRSPLPSRFSRHACGASVLVETFTAGSPELALVDVVLFDVTGVGLALLIACGSDVVDGVEADDVQRLQRALRC